MKKYLFIFFFAFALVTFEYYCLNFKPQYSILLLLQAKGFIRQTVKISADPGRPVSLWLGWIGLGAMIIMNVYSMRKRLGFMQSWGKLSNWLNFHIFCGLLGPLFIVFHCNFKVRGIVAISFWSMVVSFTSGIVGRYFYAQLLKARVDLETEATQKLSRLDLVFKKNNLDVSDEEKKSYAHKALVFVGLPSDFENISLLNVLANSIVGDFRRLFYEPITPDTWPVVSKYILTDYAVSQRRALFLESFQLLMGHWHTFHFPFAIFMYAVAIIHVAAALILGI